MLDLPVSHRGEPSEHVAQVGVGIDAAAAATLDNGVKDGAALAVGRHRHRQGTASSFFQERSAEWSFPRGCCRSQFGHLRGRHQARAKLESA
jgi:hypothetical protein